MKTVDWWGFHIFVYSNIIRKVTVFQVESVSCDLLYEKKIMRVKRCVPSLPYDLGKYEKKEMDWTAGKQTPRGMVSPQSNSKRYYKIINVDTKYRVPVQYGISI